MSIARTPIHFLISVQKLTILLGMHGFKLHNMVAENWFDHIGEFVWIT